ncbi:sugar transferase [Natronorubrum tibetense]|uniref:Exopolysaccharide biosynthesis polyprenyl glycosylphosphotransferase n=1 Tax=Natronorubrum tibetense GA33 TaxID=1114856 RepID=L9WBT4_9EURY|nr:sugar transferase [Natronorubrum tibetense]ELY45773.1 exopolysaccharide biosynthesis polyprenyl glycosylphosphotransferase [Natronorubrum tibetense GA33]
MFTGWRYRTVSVVGVILLTVGAVLVANHQLSQALFTTHVPLFNRLEVTVLTGESLYWAVLLSALAIGGSLVPLYKPQPRRVLDTVFFAQRRVIVGGLALATLGYFKWSHRLPRATLVMTIGALVVAIPAWFVWIHRSPADDPGRTLVVGDDLEQMERITPAIDVPVLGYLYPSVVGTSADSLSVRTVADGGITAGAEAGEGGAEVDVGALDRLGGLSRLETVLLQYDVDTVVLAFHQPDRAEFFGALDVCHKHGIDVKIHREYADAVLVAEDDVEGIVDVDLEPWDPLDHLFKRLFDVTFGAVGLVGFAPLFIVIALAIKLDSPGPALYSQDRTAGFGDTFPVYKFRTMVPEGESAVPSSDGENDRITAVGRVLRRTHLDELPQLWSIFVGDMSVVGPRAAWTEEEVLLEEDAPAWRKRWFVKPGLTGLAQVNGAKSTNPEAKLRYDLEYIRKQSPWFDLKIVIRQVWGVLEDVHEILRQ